ncbi:MAG: MipA/OmpV family protein [Rhodoferax sp.]|nr:MipA/OmpV family protein [Rhodoferax sp.]
MSTYPFKRLSFSACAAIACGAAIGSSAWAQDTSAPPLWELGGVALGASQQAYPGSDQQVNKALVLPFFIYRGEMLRADRDTVGIRALKTPSFELDVGIAGTFGAGSGALDARQGMPELGTLVEFGPRLKWNLGAAPGGGRLRAEIPLRAVFDLSDQAAHKGLSFEPKLVYERQSNNGWRYSASVGAVIADTKLAQTLYEVGSAEVTAQRPAYSAKSGLVAWRAGTSFSRSLNRDWSLFGFARVDTVAGAANESSPLVRQTTGVTAGLGVSYTWMRSERRAQD